MISILKVLGKILKQRRVSLLSSISLHEQCSYKHPQLNVHGYSPEPNRILKVNLFDSYSKYIQSLGAAHIEKEKLHRIGLGKLSGQRASCVLVN